MRLPLLAIVTLTACITPVAFPSEGTAATPAQASNGKVTTKSTTPPPVTTSSPTPPRQETLEEIVARVRRRLALETPRDRRPVPPRPPVNQRVKLVWRPAVVWPPELAPEAAAAAPAIDPKPDASSRP